jgi:hypothetical protein
MEGDMQFIKNMDFMKRASRLFVPMAPEYQYGLGKI